MTVMSAQLRGPVRLLALALLGVVLSACSITGSDGPSGPAITPPPQEVTSQAPSTQLVAPNPLSETPQAQLLSNGTPDILNCVAHGGSACVGSVLLLDEVGGGAIPSISTPPSVRTDAVAAHDLARQVFGATTPTAVAAIAPRLRSAVNKLRADFGLPPLPG
jgi:hypothetical protein